MGDLYCSRQNVYGLGVPRGALVRPTRLIASVDAAQNVLELEGHGFTDGDALQFTVDAGGVLPAPLAVTTIYYAKLLELDDDTTSESLFQVAASSGGAALDLVDAGTAPFGVAVPIGPTLDANIETYSRWFDTIAPAEVVPLAAPYPKWVSQIVALRSAVATVTELGLAGFGALIAREDKAIIDALRLAKGLRIRDGNRPSANTAIVRSAARAAQACRGRLP